MIGAALSVVGTAMAPFKDSLLEKWAASVNLGPNVKALELELLAVQALLEPAIGKEIVDNSALKKLLVILQELGYDAEDVLDELDYFRIQDELDNTSDTAEKHAKSCAHNLAFHAKAVGKQICLPACLFATNAGAERKTNWRFNGCKPKLSSRACCNASHVVVEELNIEKWSASGKELTQLLTYFPKLSELMLWHCENISGLGVMGQQPMETPGPSSSAKKLDEQCQQQDDLIVLEQDGLFLLPPQLQVLWIYDCPKLSLCSNPHDDNKEEGRTGGGGGGGGGGGLQGSSLRRLSINSLPNFLSSYSSSAVYSFLFPNSLENLILLNEVGMETLPLSNLSSLTRLDIEGCGDLRGKGLLSLLAQGCLTELIVKGTPNFFVDSDISQVHEQEFPSYSSKLQLLSTDDVAGVTAAPICRLLVSSLTKLSIWDDKVVERFTEEQEILLFANSLEEIMFSYCDNLQYLPAWLHRLPNLKRLLIDGCKSIQMLPKGSLPSSLQELQIKYCPKIRSLPEEGLPSSVQVLEIWDCPKIGSLTKDGLPSSLQKLVIFECPGIQSLPKVDDLPSSLRELDIMRCGNEELKRQCRRLIGIIPIVKA
nr:unnamed protein product [Digitaria exilis]